MTPCSVYMAMVPEIVSYVLMEFVLAHWLY